MKVIVTGGSGFLGSFLCERLRDRGHEVIVLDRAEPRWTPWAEWHPVDVGDPRSADLISEIGADAVINMAGLLGTAETFDWPQETVRVNTIGTITTLEACKRLGARYIGVETGTPWLSPYAISKRAATDFARGYGEAFGLQTSVLKVFNAYGPRQDGTGKVNKIVPRFAANALRGEPLPIFGDGRQVIDVCHADDVAECFALALERAPGVGEVLQVGSGVPITVLEVADRVLDLCGGGELEFLPRRLGEGQEYPVADTTMIRNVLGFVPAPLDERLSETIEWYRTHVVEPAATLS
ncbi:MAG: NAD-dependent epimerase/dehydratase family protein [Actinomycetota bacterium]|nr:NAD-dependent epimerase/dehydratase family protein [Actinomycetota bacterium]